MENKYQKQYPDVMRGKKIMYVHGFASSAASGSVTRMREMLPSATVVAEDIPVDPHEGLAMLREMAARECPDLIVGTSMGGMYAEQLHGFDRILINPAFEIASTMGAHGMTGRQQFLNPRKDGVGEFMVTKAMVREYRSVQEGCFADTSEEEQRRVWGLFGDKDSLVHTFPLFSGRYRNALWFHGAHRMNDKVFSGSVLPVIRWIDDRQERRERQVVYVCVDALRDKYGNQVSSARKTFRLLSETYEVFFVAPSPNYDAAPCAEVQSWLKENVGVPAYNHIVFTDRPQLLLGDFLITPHGAASSHAFMGTVVSLGSPTFKTWDEIAEYFGRIGGQ